MAQCLSCGDEYDDKRKELGYKTCLACGDKAAQIRAAQLRESTAPAFNKGPYQPVTSVEQAKWIGRK